MDFHEKQPYHHYYQHRATSNYMPLKSIDNRNRAEDESHHFKKSEIKDLIIQMNEALKCQREEIESLKRSQDAHQHQLKTCIDTSLKQFLLTQQQQQINAYMSTPANELQQNLINSLLVILEKIIKDEISKLMHSQFSMHVLEPLKEQISQELTEKLNSFESVFKDSALKLFISKPTMDTLSQSVVTSLQTNIVNSYRETFQKVVVPNFEKSCQNMYQQVNSSFAKGTQDYLIEFDKIAKLQRKSFDENKDPILSKMKQFSDKMQLHGSQVGTSIAASLQQQIESNLRDTNAILQVTFVLISF
jgi:enhancer of mRNA-decapping protein 4